MKSGTMRKANVTVRLYRRRPMLSAFCLETAKESDRLEDIGIDKYNIKIGL